MVGAPGVGKLSSIGYLTGGPLGGRFISPSAQIPTNAGSIIPNIKYLNIKCSGPTSFCPCPIANMLNFLGDAL